MANKTPLLERSYHIPLAMFDDAFRNFQKKYAYPQNFLLTAVLLAVAGVYVHAVIKDNTQTLAYILILSCIAVILVRWYRTLKLRRSVHEALKEVEQDTYALSVFEDGLEIRTEDAPAAEESAPEAEVPAEPEPADSEKPDGNGFQQLFPEEPAEDEPIPPTEIRFGNGVKIHEYPEYFLVYLVRSNFYVIPKKDFSEDETAQLRKIFRLA